MAKGTSERSGNYLRISQGGGKALFANCIEDLKALSDVVLAAMADVDIRNHLGRHATEESGGEERQGGHRPMDLVQTLIHLLGPNATLQDVVGTGVTRDDEAWEVGDMVRLDEREAPYEVCDVDMAKQRVELRRAAFNGGNAGKRTHWFDWDRVRDFDDDES